MTMQRTETTILPSKVLSVILFLMTLVILVPLISHFGIALKPNDSLAQGGETFLSEVSFSENKTISLAGEWAFFERRLVEPQDIQNQINDASFIEGSGGWTLSGENTDTVLGYGTYHLKVNVPAIESNLALQVPRVYSAYKLFINEKIVASGGVVATSSIEAKPSFRPTIVNIPNNIESFSLTVQVTNFHSSWGGIWSPIVIGHVDSLYSVQRDLVALSMFIIGALIVTTAFYLIQYYFRPFEKIPLAFACLCLVFLLREFTAEHMYFVLEFFSISYTAALKLNYLTFYLGVLNVLYFMHLSFPKVFNDKISKFLYFIGIIFSLFVIFSPTSLIGYSLVSYQLFCFGVMLYIFVNMVMANVTKQPTAKMMAFSTIILGLFAINDMLYAAGIVSTGNFFSIGIVGFIICQSYVISNRFNHIITNNEALSLQLQQSNSELHQLGVELENKVDMRTKQLEKANFELDKLARIDKLTGLLNRHGLQPHLQRAFENLQNNLEPSCFVLYDFDNFKYINDTFGHDLGDSVLVLGAKVIKDKIRNQDKLARWGGEEFLVCLPSTNLAGALEIAEKIRLAIESMPVSSAGVEVPITITGGVAELKQGETFEALFKRADNALYKGKSLGRNCIQS